MILTFNSLIYFLSNTRCCSLPANAGSKHTMQSITNAFPMRRQAPGSALPLASADFLTPTWSKGDSSSFGLSPPNSQDQLWPEKGGSDKLQASALGLGVAILHALFHFRPYIWVLLWFFTLESCSHNLSQSLPMSIPTSSFSVLFRKIAASVLQPSTVDGRSRCLRHACDSRHLSPSPQHRISITKVWGIYLLTTYNSGPPIIYMPQT